MLDLELELMDALMSMNVPQTLIIVLMKLTVPIRQVDSIANVKLDIVEMEYSVQVRVWFLKIGYNFFFVRINTAFSNSY